MDGRGYENSRYENKYQYNGKELEDDLFAGNKTLMWYHYGARYYDPQLGKWWVVDPADEFNSPYVYVSNNPIHLLDPDGEITGSSDGSHVYRISSGLAKFNEIMSYTFPGAVVNVLGRIIVDDPSYQNSGWDYASVITGGSITGISLALKPFANAAGKTFLDVHSKVLTRFTDAANAYMNNKSEISQTVRFYLEDKTFDVAQTLGYGHRSSTHPESVFEVGASLMRIAKIKSNPKEYILNVFNEITNSLKVDAEKWGFDLNTEEGRKSFDVYYKIQNDNLKKE